MEKERQGFYDVYCSCLLFDDSTRNFFASYAFNTFAFVAPLLPQLLHQLIGNVKVGMNLLHIVVVF